MMAHEYSFVFEKEGKYNDIWLAGTNQTQFRQKMKKGNIESYHIYDICTGIEEDILKLKETQTMKPHKKRRRLNFDEMDDIQKDENVSPSAFSLKLASNLMMGTVRIYGQQVNHLYEQSKGALAKQEQYNALVQAEDAKEERRGKRINYTEMMDTAVQHSHKRTKTNKVPVKFSVKDLDSFEQMAAYDDNDGLDWLTANQDEITLRETYGQETPFSFSNNHEIEMNEFEPLGQDEIDEMMEGLDFIHNSSLEIEHVRQEPVHNTQVPQIEYQQLSFYEQPENEELIPEIQKMASLNIQADDEILPYHNSSGPLLFEHQPMQVNDHSNPIELLFQQHQNSEISFKLPKIKKKLLKKKGTVLNRKTLKRGMKRKLDEIMIISKDQMIHQMVDYSDTVSSKDFYFPTSKKFKSESVEHLTKLPGQFFRGLFSQEIIADFSLKLRFMSLSDKTRKRKIEAVYNGKEPKNEPLKKKIRTSDEYIQEPQPNQLISHVDIPLPDLIPKDPIAESPIVVKVENNGESFYPELDILLNELLSCQELDDNLNVIQNGVTIDKQKKFDQKEDLEWKYIKHEWGQFGLIKKLVGIFHDKNENIAEMDLLIGHETTKKIGTVAFTSLIYLKTKKYLILEKNDKLEITFIKEGPKLANVLNFNK